MVLNWGEKRDKNQRFSNCNFFPKNSNGQLTIFIILAVILVAGIALYFFARQDVFVSEIPAEFEPIYNTFLSCLQDNAKSGIDILETQAGYIELPEFEPGSSFMPFSSQLDFLGNPIPYWYYVSGNNFPKEQIPSKSDMQKQLANYINGKIQRCRFDNYYDEGFAINFGEGGTSVVIGSGRVDIVLERDLTISKGNESVVVSSHRISVNSELGNLYDSARKVYDYEQSSMFLEKYGIDSLRLYAPVDGVELTCSPLVWDANKIYSDLRNAIESNTLAMTTKNSVGNADKYFISDIPVQEEVRFINSRNWSNSFEVNPSQEDILISSPVGTQPGLGILGFCYVPYHFVYSVKYPVLVQVSGKSETFQFPFAVVIEGNKPRIPESESISIQVEIPELCNEKNNVVNVNVFDNKFNLINAEISYECSGTRCYIGKTNNGNINEMFPQCVNGYIIAKSDGFEEQKNLYSVTQSGETNIFLNKIYEKEILLKIDGRNYNGQATISFVSSDRGSKTIAYPEQKIAKLSEGQYEVLVQMFRNSSLNIGATKTEQCIEIPQTGVGGFFGFTKEKCFNIEIPAQIVSNALSGGGKQDYYISESELANSGKIEIGAPSLPIPDSLEQLQQNYILIEEENLDINFK